MFRTRFLHGLVIAASFFGVAMFQAWPLPLHLSDSLTGNPGGDTGVYVWNIWVFRHELIERHSSPLTTEAILPMGGGADLSLHNYTIFADLLALPLQSVMNVVSAFNVVYLVNVMLAGIGMFLLAQRLRRTAPVGTAEAWLAGLLFACSPFLVARSTAHFSLAAAAPLPFFVLCVDRLWHGGRWRDGALAGACLAWAAFSDLYYAVYAVLLGLVVVGAHYTLLSARWRPTPYPRFARVLSGVIALLAVLIVARRVIGWDAITIGSLVISMRTIYTPMLALTFLVALRMALMIRVSVDWRPPAAWRPVLGSLAMMAAVAAILLGPELYAIALRVGEGRMVAAPVLWRSSAPGVDLVSFLLPNPNHPLAPDALVEWFQREPGRYEENVVSIPWVAILVIVAAWRWANDRPSRMWLTIAAGAAALAVGPFLRIAGIDTYLPTPWTFVRYLPIVGEARMPARFGVIVIMAVAMVFAGALASLRRSFPERQRLMLAVVAVLLAFELLPAPRRLYPATIPAVYDTIAQDPRPVRVLELPYGIRDGLSSIGDFSAASQFYQTKHKKPLMGGYLSRVSESRKAALRDHAYVTALIEKSEGRALDWSTRASAAAAGPAFVASANIGYVVIDRSRASEALQQFAIETLNLVFLESDGALSLYEPRTARQEITKN